MSKSLVIVESPAKAKTIGNLLNKKKYKVVASVGHIRDLPKSTLGIDVDNNYEPKYITIRGKGPIVAELKAEAKKSDNILLATDPDREGEAISWHLAHILKIDDKDKVRVEFNEITKEAINKAIDNPRRIDIDLVDAQQARRILDRLVGYKISPLLWKKIRRGLSAGRVQSVAVKLVCDREEEIDVFIPEEYWSIPAILKKDDKTFDSEFYGIEEDGKDKKIELSNEEEVNEVVNNMDKEKMIVRDVRKGQRRRNPYRPYTTSTLQQDAYGRLGFTSRKTMVIAQQLYEGINIKGKGTEGLITYMRTDSTRISDEAIGTTVNYLKKNYGEEYSQPRNYSGKKKKESQDAHEAIRPTLVTRHPAEIRDSLSEDQHKLYKLIWERFVSSQMTPAVYDTISVNVTTNGYIFRSSGSILKFDGFLKVYGTNHSEKDKEITELKEGDLVGLEKLDPTQHFTKPPARFTEASLIKTLEELGIGRPSTFAPTIGTIVSRDYVGFDQRSFVPTDLGILVNDLLTEYFSDIINEQFTAQLEENLDDIAEGEKKWREVVGGFYTEFAKILEVAEDEIKEMEIKDEVTDEICEKCGKNMVIKHGRYGKFLACPGYPECKNTKAIVEELGIECPKCGDQIIKRKSKRGRVFYGCNAFPDCDFVSWDEPIKEKCPECNGLLTRRRTKSKETTKCYNEECGYEKIEER